MISTFPSGSIVCPSHMEELKAITELTCVSEIVIWAQLNDKCEKELRAGRELNTQTVEG